MRLLLGSGFILGGLGRRRINSAGEVAPVDTLGVGAGARLSCIIVEAIPGLWGIPAGDKTMGKVAMINQERLLDSFRGLVRIDSPSDEEEEVAQHLVTRLGSLGFKVERDAHGNVIASEVGDDPLLLSAHMDTVEPGRGIKPTIQGDRIVSDGTTILGGDCKAGVAAILEGLESVAESGLARRPVQVVFTRGEEIGLIGAT